MEVYLGGGILAFICYCFLSLFFPVQLSVDVKDDKLTFIRLITIIPVRKYYDVKELSVKLNVINGNPKKYVLYIHRENKFVVSLDDCIPSDLLERAMY